MIYLMDGGFPVVVLLQPLTEEQILHFPLPMYMGTIGHRVWME